MWSGAFERGARGKKNPIPSSSAALNEKTATSERWGWPSVFGKPRPEPDPNINFGLGSASHATPFLPCKPEPAAFRPSGLAGNGLAYRCRDRCVSSSRRGLRLEFPEAHLVDPVDDLCVDASHGLESDGGDQRPNVQRGVLVLRAGASIHPILLGSDRFLLAPSGSLSDVALEVIVDSILLALGLEGENRRRSE